jgi:glucoamylase
MVQRAASYVARNGPATPEDRWEEDGGYSPFTLAAEIAALLAAADFADAAERPDAARYLRETADIWNESIERWTYVTGTDLSRSTGVDGYYARIAPRNVDDGGPPSARVITIRNHPPGTVPVLYGNLVSPDALALVRFGLRSATDERMLNTIRVIDRVLRTETPSGPVWHRYNEDGYGEHEDGSAFDGTGIGRGWPLLAGERGHYELAAGNRDEARRLLGVMRAQASSGGLIPEQVWDAPDIPQKSLIKGCPSGSAMPLVWAHAEYVKLAQSLEIDRIFDMPPQTVQRYARGNVSCPFAMWRFNHKIRTMAPGRTLRVEAQARFVLQWTCGNNRPRQECEGIDTTIGVWFADLAAELLPAGSEVQFTFYWPDADRWEGTSYSVSVGAT